MKRLTARLLHALERKSNSHLVGAAATNFPTQLRVHEHDQRHMRLSLRQKHQQAGVAKRLTARLLHALERKSNSHLVGAAATNFPTQLRVHEHDQRHMRLSLRQ